METKGKLAAFIRKTENATVVRAVRDGLIHIIPVLIIGAFALILQTLPVNAYQRFLTAFLGGALLNLFEIVYNATFGVLSVYMAYSISRSFMKIKGDGEIVNGGATVTSLLCFFILAGAYLPDFGKDNMGPKSMFLAIITGLGASYLYLVLSRFLKKRKKALFMVGAYSNFNRMLSTFFPILTVTVLFGLVNLLLIKIFDVDSFRTLLANLFNFLFAHGKTDFFKGFLFVMLSSVLWFFGIHGSDTLENVMQTYFVPGLAQNQAAVAAGGNAANVLTKEFFDCFVLMGGCGATICLLIAILIFSKSRARRGLALTAAFPMIFNINELMVFGLPIIFNPIMLFPFIITPLVCYSVAYTAVATGIVPAITSEVAWTTPVILGGYRATGSAAGAILQIVNIVIGVIIYIPFVRMLDKQRVEEAKNNYDRFLQYFKENEQSLTAIRITEINNVNGNFARDLCNDLKYSLSKQVKLAYQPQYRYDGSCMGAEALLRWEHPLLGVIYPPLVIKLAEDGGFLAELEEKILERALAERPKLITRFGEGIKLSVNVTGTTVVTPRYVQFCRQLNEKEPFAGKNICIEVTEKAAIAFNDETINAMRSLHQMGLLLAIDDFSMGQTSINYLRDNLFDIIKLDGALVNGIFTYTHSRDIISSIVQLANNLNMIVLAEFVDTNEKREALHDLGCDNYQGYLYSPAVYLKEN